MVKVIVEECPGHSPFTSDFRRRPRNECCWWDGRSGSRRYLSVSTSLKLRQISTIAVLLTCLLLCSTLTG